MEPKFLRNQARVPAAFHDGLGQLFARSRLTLALPSPLCTEILQEAQRQGCEGLSSCLPPRGAACCQRASKLHLATRTIVCH